MSPTADQSRSASVNATVNTQLVVVPLTLSTAAAIAASASASSCERGPGSKAFDSLNSASIWAVQSVTASVRASRIEISSAQHVARTSSSALRRSSSSGSVQSGHQRLPGSRRKFERDVSSFEVILMPRSQHVGLMRPKCSGRLVRPRERPVQLLGIAGVGLLLAWRLERHRASLSPVFGVVHHVGAHHMER